MPFFALAATGIASSLIGASSASSAANDQKNAANNQLKFNENLLNAQTTREAPFLTPAYNAEASLAAGTTTGAGGVGTGALNAPFNPANLDQTPGYQFEMQQGLEALGDAQSAQGGATGGPLGVGGGNQLKAITQFGQGLAGTTYQQQLQDYMAQQSQQYNELQGIVGTGQNAIAGIGGANSTAAGQISSAFAGQGNAASAGAIGVGNALSSGLSGLSNDFLLSNLLGGGGGSNGTLSSLLGLGGNPGFANFLSG